MNRGFPKVACLTGGKDKMCCVVCCARVMMILTLLLCCLFNLCECDSAFIWNTRVHELPVRGKRATQWGMLIQYLQKCESAASVWKCVLLHPRMSPFLNERKRTTDCDWQPWNILYMTVGKSRCVCMRMCENYVHRMYSLHQSSITHEPTNVCSWQCGTTSMCNVFVSVMGISPQDDVCVWIFQGWAMMA